MSLPRRTRIALAVAGVLIAVPVIAVVAIERYDWNRARPWLNDKIGTALQRQFAIRGPLSLTWQRPALPPSVQRGWRDYLPWPHLLAQDVHLGNPAAMVQAGAPPEMASVGRFDFSLDPFALLHHSVAIPVLRFDAPALLLRRAADDSNNWTFGDPDRPSSWHLDIERIIFTKGTVHYVADNRDPKKRADVSANIDTVNADPRYGVAWTVKGLWNQQPVSGGGKAGAVLSLQRQTAPYPLAADLTVGASSVAIVGTLTKPTALTALDLRLKVAAPSMARLYGLTGVVLPETPPFATEGHLTGELGAHSSHWTYDQFTGRVGGSDIGGKLDYRSGAPRGLLSGTVASRLLQFSDLGPLIGADSNASKAARGETAVQPSDRVLPTEPFRTERWTSVDTDVRYQARQIVRDKDLPLSNLDTVFHLHDGVLALTPLNFDIAGGTLKSTVKLDGSGKVSKDVIRAELKATARHLELKQLFPTLPSLQASVGSVNGDAALTAVGNSVASLLGSSNGEVKTLIDQGTISKLLLEEMGLNIGNVVLTKLAGDKQVKLNCMATDFLVTNGLMQTRSFIVDTDDATLNVTGTINLANEQLDMTLKPDSKGLRVFSLRAPLYVRGPFKHPDVSVDKGVLALRSGGALALAVLAPVAALAPLISTTSGGNSGCAALLAAARAQPVAPPPGKTPALHPARPGHR
ncbi:AsmA family protein [Rugamonas sp.]|uniref:AsmA family protein n=1 Tax=Rugamonas sp. TaxID=1926287 RepID=UPI0025D756BE|nr:AsmA family protein [Rugamonas sp.]